MATQWEMVDQFVEDWLAKHPLDAPFRAEDLAKWLRRTTRHPYTRPDASALLQTHRLAHRHHKEENQPKYVLQCSHPGRDARWSVATAEHARPMLQRVCQEKARAVVTDMVCRVNPAADLDVATAATVRVIENAVSAQLQVLGTLLGFEVDTGALAREEALV